MNKICIDGVPIGGDAPVYVIGEIGINHNGDLDIAKQLMKIAADAGAQAVKFQKRTPDIATPEHMKTVMRETPWGTMTYLDYRYKVEFEKDEYTEIDRYAKELGISWFASPWDQNAVDFLEEMNVSAYKIASASVTDLELLKKVKATSKPTLLSTGMSTIEEIDAAVETLGNDNLHIMHATSTYPLPPEEANLRMIHTLQDRYGLSVGYSGHEKGLQISIAAVALGAKSVERHITLDRSMWGSDQAPSLEKFGFKKLVRDTGITLVSMGNGQKTVFPGEVGPRKKLGVL